jgi:DNA invertase Pin-like site-specific DNA recombinase
MGVFAEFERSMIQERVRAGLRRAKDEGKRLGRPRIAPDLERRIIVALREPGRTEGVRKIAVRFGVDPSTVQRISRPFVGAAAGLCARSLLGEYPYAAGFSECCVLGG